MPVGNAAGNPVTSWLNVLSVLIGALFVATSAYLAAVFLVNDARRAGAPDLERYFRRRALGAAARGRRARGRRHPRAAFRCPVRLRRPDDRRTAARDRLAHLRGGRPRPAQPRVAPRRPPLTVGAVVALIWGWAIAQHPYLLPTDLTIDQAAAPSATLAAVLIVFGVAALLVLPSLALLYTLAQRGAIEEDAEPRPGAAPTSHTT